MLTGSSFTQSAARGNLRLPVQRSMVSVFRDEAVSQQAWMSNAARDRWAWHGRLLEVVAAGRSNLHRKRYAVQTRRIRVGDAELARLVAGDLRAGMVNTNGAEQSFDAPFGGYKQLGSAREWGYSASKIIPRRSSSMVVD